MKRLLGKFIVLFLSIISLCGAFSVSAAAADDIGCVLYKLDGVEMEAELQPIGTWTWDSQYKNQQVYLCQLPTGSVVEFSGLPEYRSWALFSNNSKAVIKNYVSSDFALSETDETNLISDASKISCITGKQFAGEDLDESSTWYKLALSKLDDAEYTKSCIPTDSSLKGFAISLEYYGWDSANKYFERNILIVFQFGAFESKSVAPTVSYTQDGVKKEAQLVTIGTYNLSSAVKNARTQSVYLCRLPEDAVVAQTDITGYDTWKLYGNNTETVTNASVSDDFVFSAGEGTELITDEKTIASVTGEQFVGEGELSTSSAYYTMVSAKLDDAVKTLIPTSSSVKGYVLHLYKWKGSNRERSPYIVFQFASSAETVPTKDFTDLLATVTDYYQTEDRYNGKSYSDESRWAIFQKTALALAQQVDTSADTIPKAEYDALYQAMHQLLIPTSQVNSTVLYDALQQWKSKYDDQLVDSWSKDSWSAFTAAYENAQNIMDGLFDENGDATAENLGSRQSEIETAAETLTNAGNGLESRVYDYQQPEWDNAVAGIRLYCSLYDSQKLNQSDYTEDSWKTYQEAYAAAQEILASEDTFYVGQGHSKLRARMTAYRNLRAACHGLAETKDSITVRVSVIDNYSTHRKGETLNTVTRTLTLTPGATIKTVQDQLGIDITAKNAWSAGSIYLNGVLCYSVQSAGFAFYSATECNVLGLHDGDELVIAKICPETYKNISEVTTPKSLDMVTDKVKYQQITTSLENGEAVAGEPFTVSVTTSYAMPAYYDGIAVPAAGVSIYTGTASEEQETAETSAINTDTLITTDAQGQATVTLYQEGYILLYGYDLTDDGRYINGAAILIHVKPTSDLAAVKDTLKNELTAAATDENYPETYFKAEDWAAIQNAYEEGLKAIEAADNSGTAWEAQAAALKTIKAKQTSADSYNVTNLAAFRKALNSLPEVSKLDKSAETTVKTLISRYEQMTQYQLSQLTQAEIDTYNGIKAAYDAGLPEAVSYKLTVQYDFSDVPEADREGLQAMLTWLQENCTNEGLNSGDLGGGKMAGLYTFNTGKSSTTGSYTFTALTEAAAGTKIAFCASPAYAAYMHIRGDRTTTVNGAKYGDNNYVYTLSEGAWTIEDVQSPETESASEYSYNYTVADEDSYTYTVNGSAYTMSGLTVEGLDNDDLTSRYYGFFDFSDYMNKHASVMYVHIDDSFRDFTMPYEDVTITVKWAPAGGSTNEIETARAKALSALQAAYAGYDSAHANYAAITAAYEEGVTAVQAAVTLDGVSEARKNAIDAMKKAAKGSTAEGAIDGWSEGDAFDAGAQVGTVTVSLENATFDDGYFYYTNWVGESNPTGAFILKEDYALGENDSMMTVVLRALADSGASWAGTGGSDSADYSITYLSSVTLDGRELGEFGGGEQSGWMGTLNDWFTNLSFSEFTVANGQLGDGDVIRIQYTSNGLGADIGGTWGNSDTTLKALDVEGGTLATAFTPGEAGGTYEYTLMIDGDSANVKLTPTASNKNFLTKIFLNEQVTDNTEGSSFYKRTETIPVADGDVIYVGCGISTWPSMNNQEGNTQDNDGTWYVLRVVSADEGSDYVDSLIAALPDTISYNEYKAKKSGVEAARAAYNALTDTAKSQVKNYDKLEKLEEIIASFEKVDDFKQQLAAIPGAKYITLENSDAVATMKTAYDALSKEQKQNLTVAEAQKVEDLVNRIAELVDEQDRAAAAAVDQLIDQIGEVAVESEPDITAARTAYEALTDTQKKYVTKLETLTNAELQLQNLKDAAAAKPVEDKIAALPAAENLTLADASDIAAARAAFEALTDTQKNLVPNLGTLQAAETKLAELKEEAEKKAEKEAADKTAAEGAENKINALPGTLTLGDKSAVEDAKAAYDALTEDQKGYVSGDAKQKLDAAVAEIARLEEEKANKEAAAVVDRLIDAIGEVSLNSKPTIETARKAYEQLTETQKGFVEKYDVLTAAEIQYAKLVDEAAADYVRERIDSLGDISLDSREDIEAARAAYDVLTDSQKPLISADTYQKLTDAETQYAKLVDEAAAAEVSEKIEAIGEVTLDSQEKIEAARAAYALLTDSQKTLISADTYQKLTDAENKLAELQAAQKAEEDKKAAEVVDSKISAIGDVTLNSEKAIKDARVAYNALTADQKALVQNLKTLTDAETKLQTLKDEAKKKEDSKKDNKTDTKTNTNTKDDAKKSSGSGSIGSSSSTTTQTTPAKTGNGTTNSGQSKEDKKAAQDVDTQIEAIGEVTLDSEKAIQDARAAYDALTAEQKELVQNLDELMDAEDELQALKDGAETEEDLTRDTAEDESKADTNESSDGENSDLSSSEAEQTTSKTNANMWWLIVLLCALAVGLIIFIIVKKKKNDEDESGE